MRFIRAFIAFTALSFIASAGPLTWTLTGVTFDDGGTASGSFVYDADVNVYSSISIVTTRGSTRNGTNYSFLCSGSCNGLIPDDNDVLFLTQSSSSNLTGTSAFAILPAFNAPLTDAGGTRLLTGTTAAALEASCSDATCSNPTPPLRNVNAGSIVALTSTPEPSSALLSAAGLMLAFARSRGFRRALR